MAYTVEQLQTALSRAQTPEDKAHIQKLLTDAEGPVAVERNLPSKTEAFARGTADGATFGFIDEIIGGAQLWARGGAARDMAGKPIADNDKAPRQIYTDARDKMRADNNAASVAHPYTYLGGQVTGGVLVPGLGGSGAARSVATTGLGATGRMAALGSMAGGLYGAGQSESESLGGVAVDSAQGAAVGAVGGVVGAAAGKLLTAVGSAAADLVRKVFTSTPKSVAERLIAKQLRAAGFETVEAVEAELTRLGPNARLADLVPDVAEMVAQSGKPAAKVVKSALYNRDRGMATRVADAAEDSLKPIAGGRYYQFLDKLTEVKKNIAGPLYERALNTKLAVTDYMKTFATAKPGTPKAGFWQEAVDRVATKRAAGDKISHANVFHELQKVIRGKMEAAYVSGDKDAGRSLHLMRKELVREMDNLLPGYNQARRIYGGAARNEEAAELGRGIIAKQKIMGEDFNRLTRDFSEAEMESMRVGLMRGVMDVVEGARDTADVTVKLAQSPRIRMILKQAFRKPEDAEKFLEAAGIEQEFRRTLTQVTGNSRTAARLAMSASMKGGSELMEQVGSSPVGIAVNAVKNSLQKMSSNLDDAELEATASLIVKQMPKDTVGRIMRRLSRDALMQTPGDAPISGAVTGAMLPPASGVFAEQAARSQ